MSSESMEMTDDEIIILHSAYEDCCPIWEAKWELQNRQRACDAVKSLYRKGLITFRYRTAWAEGEFMEIQPEEIQAIADDLDNDVHWEISDNDINSGYYLYAITDKGAEVYKNDLSVKDYNKRQIKEL